MAPGASGVTSIELLLDDAAEARVRAEWDALAAAGMSSMAAHPGASNRPHVTLLARLTAVPHPLRLDAGALPMPLVLGPPLLLGDGERRVLARSIVPSAALLALQAAVLRAAGRGDEGPHFALGRWTPHVTLAKRIRLVDLPEALGLLGPPIEALGLLGPPIEALGVALRRWDAATATVSPVAMG